MVDRADALAAQLLVGACQIGVLEGGADLREPAAGQEELGGVGEVLEAVLVALGLGPEGVVDGEAVPGEPLGRFEHRAQVLRAPTVERRLPGRGGARGADAQAAGDRVGERQRFAVLQEEPWSAVRGAVSRPSMVSTRWVRAS